MTIDNRKDPFLTFNFRVEIDGIVSAGFSEVTGLSMETEIETKKEGGLNDSEHHFVKTTKYPNIVLKKGLTDDATIWNWYKNVAHGKIERKNGTIHLLDDIGKTMRSWDFFEAFPIKWEGPAFNASSASIAIESITLVHRGLL